jgi:VanZ family protein
VRPLRLAILWVLLGVVLLGLTVYLSLQAPQRLGLSLQGLDKPAHLAAFFLLTIWFIGLVERRAYLRVALVLLAVGVGIEVAQGIMQLGRQAEWWDLWADATGIVLGIGVSLLSRTSPFEWIERR